MSDLEPESSAKPSLAGDDGSVVNVEAVEQRSVEARD